jgi:hypothetical protein
MQLRHKSVLAAILCLAAVSSAAAAQGGALAGRVLDNRTQQGVPNALIVFVADSRSVRSDSLGGYRFEPLPSGILRFTIRAPGFSTLSITVALAQGEQMGRDIRLDSIGVFASVASAGSSNAQKLPAVSVQVEPNMDPRFADFERRRRTGRGQYLGRKEIENSNATSLQDAVRGMRGVTLDCGGSLMCAVRMARAPAQCPPNFIVDGRIDNSFGPRTSVRDIEAIEVYTGPSELPGEYAGVENGCGAVVIWTRSAPPRRPKP